MHYRNLIESKLQLKSMPGKELHSSSHGKLGQKHLTCHMLKQEN